MKSIYQKQILKEKLRKKINKGLIQRLQNYMDKDSPIDKKIFYDTSMLVSANDFEKSYEGKINTNAQVVMTYIGDNFIQSLKTGEWVVTIDDKEFRDKNVKVIEEKLWESIKNKFK